MNQSTYWSFCTDLADALDATFGTDASGDYYIIQHRGTSWQSKSIKEAWEKLCNIAGSLK